MKRRILLTGGGGHCHSVIDSVLSSGFYEKIGVIAKDQDNYDELLKDPLISSYLTGTDADLNALFRQGWTDAFITLGSIGNTRGRRALYSVIREIGFEIPSIVDPSAIVSDQAVIKEGSFIGKSAVINAGANIGTCVIINSGAIIEHDCQIGDFVHISPGTVLCGQVVIGRDSHIGAGSVIKQAVTVGSDSIVGAGSVVLKEIPDCVKAYGNPCKVVE